MLRRPGAALAALALLSSPAAAQRTEVLEVPSRTLTDAQFLAGDATSGTPVTLTGRLRPPGDAGPYPAVVLMHGSEGPVSGPVARWEWAFQPLGIATFSLDSFTARGVTETATDQSRLGSFTQLYDVYRALDALAADPRIDPDRIAVMGFSRGGVAALYSAMTRFQRRYGSEARIAAHLPFYPACNFGLRGELDVTGAPIREFHGAADTYTSAAPCRGYIARLAAAGHDAAMTEYPGVLHGFDGRAGPPWAADLATSRNCRRVERDGVLVSETSGRPFTWSDPCVEYGVGGGYDAGATARAKTAVATFLTEVFALPPP
jgi:dienelactone hydrolase